MIGSDRPPRATVAILISGDSFEAWRAGRLFRLIPAMTAFAVVIVAARAEGFFQLAHAMTVT
jgi:hypothetical protein